MGRGATVGMPTLTSRFDAPYPARGPPLMTFFRWECNSSPVYTEIIPGGASQAPNRKSFPAFRVRFHERRYKWCNTQRNHSASTSEIAQANHSSQRMGHSDPPTQILQHESTQYEIACNKTHTTVPTPRRISWAHAPQRGTQQDPPAWTPRRTYIHGARFENTKKSMLQD